MKTVKTIIASITLIAFIIPCCRSQNIEYRYKIRPNIKAKIDSIYPKATISIVLNDTYVSDTTQEIDVNCHCKETISTIILVFDTNANLLEKEVHYPDMKNLPDTILNYMKKNSSKSVKFSFGFMIKCINSKGEISYVISKTEGITSYDAGTEYYLKFKPTGELISKEKQEPETR